MATPNTYVIPTYKCKMVKDGSVKLPQKKMSNFEQASDVIRKLTDSSPVELFIVCYVNGQNEVTGTEITAKGGQHGCAITARDVLRGAIIRGASAIIVGHNHPSGDPTPSREDITMTLALQEACNVVGVPLLDHIVVAFGTTQAYSILELGSLMAQVES